jgi:hypothetical protein
MITATENISHMARAGLISRLISCQINLISNNKVTRQTDIMENVFKKPVLNLESIISDFNTNDC